MPYRRILTAVAAASSLLLVLASPVLAECWPPPPGRNDVVPVAFAFTATVEKVSRDVDPPMPENAEFDWHLELAVTRTYRGSVPERLVLNGWDVGCSSLRPKGLQAGQRIFITLDQLDLRDNPSLYGRMLLWQRIDSRWEFAKGALEQGTDSRYWPTAARRASTTAQILALVARSPMPDTATVPPNGPSGTSGGPLLALVFVSTIGVILLRLPRKTT